MATPIVEIPTAEASDIVSRDPLSWTKARLFLSSLRIRALLSDINDRVPWSRVKLTAVFLFIIVGGVCRSIEAGCQNSLKLALHNVWLCSAISYAVAFAGITALLFLMIALFGRQQWPTRADIKSLPLWSPFGGLIGGATIFAMIAFASSIGVSTFNALIIAGQMLFAVVLDHFGWMNFPRRRINPQRVAACVMIVVGAYVMAKY